jgi:hypothetical protein
MRCYEIKYHKLMDGVSLAEVPEGATDAKAAS